MLTEVLHTERKRGKKKSQIFILAADKEEITASQYVCGFGNTLCKGNGASDAADPFGNSDLCKGQQHPKPRI